MHGKTVQLQSVLLPDPAVCDVEELYFHRNGSRTDFNGYFNLFYIDKRKRYTDIHNLSLNIRITGYKSLLLVHDGEDIGRVELNPEALQEYRIPFPYGNYHGGCFWFALIEENDTANGEETAGRKNLTGRTVSGFYETELEKQWIRDVRIGAVICTYRRERYVVRNLRQMKERILERTELDVSSRVRVYIIDNGRTLTECPEVQELTKDCGGRVVVVPNRNAGGAGGFTRGMIEVLKAKEREGFTHVLLMDDDAAAEPDAFVRIYGLTATLKEQWKDMTVGGSMLREEIPYILYCAGEWWKNSMSVRPVMNLDLRRYEPASCGYLTGTGMERELYSGWWLCCYSLGVVREDNLPLPLFIHHDDIEFGLRNREYGTVFLNGVCVWHRGGDTIFPGSNYYYDIRNNLIETALHEKKQMRGAIRIMVHAFAAAIVRMKFRDRDLAYRALVDFLKGPEWLRRQDAEKLNRKIRNMAYPMRPIEDLRDELTGPEYRDIERQVRRDWQAYRLEMVESQGKGKSRRTLLHDLTLNGWLLPGADAVKVITPLDSPFDTFRRKKILLYEPDSKRAVILRRDYRELMASLCMGVKALMKLRNFPSVQKDYQNRWRELATREAWEKYLRIG